MKNLLSILLGLAIAACAAKGRAPAPQATSAEPSAALGVASPRQEIDALDAEITSRMSELGVARPTPPPSSCGAECPPQQMSTAAAAAVAADPQCKPARTETCTSVCTLKDSICKNAGRICDLAAQLGGTDAYANDKCTSGTASCDAAKQRCCSCM